MTEPERKVYTAALGDQVKVWNDIRQSAQGLQFGKITITFQNGRISVWEKSETWRPDEHRER